MESVSLFEVQPVVSDAYVDIERQISIRTAFVDAIANELVYLFHLGSSLRVSDQDEFISTISTEESRHTGFAHGLPKRIRDRDESFVAVAEAVCIVDFLEVVDIYHHDIRQPALAFYGVFLGYVARKLAAVVEARKRVCSDLTFHRSYVENDHQYSRTEAEDRGVRMGYYLSDTADDHH